MFTHEGGSQRREDPDDADHCHELHQCESPTADTTGNEHEVHYTRRAQRNLVPVPYPLAEKPRGDVGEGGGVSLPLANSPEPSSSLSESASKPCFLSR